MPPARSPAPFAPGGRASHDLADAPAGAANQTLSATDETPQRHRRHAERIGARPRTAARALPRPGQGQAAKLFQRGGLQPQALAAPHGLGTTKQFGPRTKPHAGPLKTARGAVVLRPRPAATGKPGIEFSEILAALGLYYLSWKLPSQKRLSWFTKRNSPAEKPP